jgi:hypothetical protein
VSSATPIIKWRQLIQSLIRVRRRLACIRRNGDARSARVPAVQNRPSAASSSDASESSTRRRFSSHNRIARLFRGPWATR